MSDTQLTVTLSGGKPDDARAVVNALQDVFGAPDQAPTDDRATVRTATFDSPTEPQVPDTPRAEGARLSAPVSVTVQGAPHAVAAASETLSRAFSARDQGASSGDQEQERQLLLEP
ncbi:hypothetical protein [Streptomyces ziwulingensis]|uniref:Uncharacterized protein n=1 Tax=Streptomyces ziwulingensis TaxID=1045501 RepID=A0ABP9B9E8_9ACTN